MTLVAVDFKKSKSAEEQRQIRAIIRRIPRDQLTKGERDILMTIVNLWFFHRGGPEGCIHPGRKKIAKRANVTVVTVARALAKLRKIEVLTAIKYAQGGTKATRYVVNLTRLRAVFDPDGVQEIDGVLVPFRVANDTVQDAGNDTVTQYQNDTRLKTPKDLCQGFGYEGGV